MFWKTWFIYLAGEKSGKALVGVLVFIEMEIVYEVVELGSLLVRVEEAPV